MAEPKAVNIEGGTVTFATRAVRDAAGPVTKFYCDSWREIASSDARCSHWVENARIMMTANQLEEAANLIIDVHHHGAIAHADRLEKFVEQWREP